MRKEILETKLDGPQPFEFWDREDFEGRVTRIISQASVYSTVVPDDLILCDFCNTDIKEFPVPVFRGSKALCQPCFKNIVKEGG